jgi:hypothetical protein
MEPEPFAPDEMMHLRWTPFDGLKRANEIRSKRAEVKQRLKAGKLPLEAVLWKDYTWMRTMRIGELLRSCPHMREVKAERACMANHINLNTELRRIPKYQREQLVRWLKRNYPATMER